MYAHVGGIGSVLVHYYVCYVCYNACAFSDVLHLLFVYKYTVLRVWYFVLLRVLVCWFIAEMLQYVSYSQT
jgi:hypothetical protein